MADKKKGKPVAGGGRLKTPVPLRVPAIVTPGIKPPLAPLVPRLPIGPIAPLVPRPGIKPIGPAVPRPGIKPIGPIGPIAPIVPRPGIKPIGPAVPRPGIKPIFPIRPIFPIPGIKPIHPIPPRPRPGKPPKGKGRPYYYGDYATDEIVQLNIRKYCAVELLNALIIALGIVPPPKKKKGKGKGK